VLSSVRPNRHSLEAWIMCGCIYATQTISGVTPKQNESETYSGIPFLRPLQNASKIFDLGMTLEMSR